MKNKNYLKMGLLISFIFVLIACSSDDSKSKNKMAKQKDVENIKPIEVGSVKQELIGKWKMQKILMHLKEGEKTQDMSKQNVVMNFKANGGYESGANGKVDKTGKWGVIGTIFAMVNDKKAKDYQKAEIKEVNAKNLTLYDTKLNWTIFFVKVK